MTNAFESVHAPQSLGETGKPQPPSLGVWLIFLMLVASALALFVLPTSEAAPVAGTFAIGVYCYAVFQVGRWAYRWVRYCLQHATESGFNPFR